MQKIFPLAFTFLLACASSCQENFDAHLYREAHEYTQKHCPMRIEAGNTLDSLTYNVNTRCLTRWHTLSGIMDTPPARLVFSQKSQLIREQLLRELRGDVEKSTCKDENIHFEYVYRSAATRQEIFRTIFTPIDYQR